MNEDFIVVVNVVVLLYELMMLRWLVLCLGIGGVMVVGVLKFFGLVLFMLCCGEISVVCVVK